MKYAALGFFSALSVAGVIFLAIWKWLDRMERRVLVQHHTR